MESAIRGARSVVRGPRRGTIGSDPALRNTDPGIDSASVRFHRLFVLEEPLFAPPAAAVAAERPVGSNHAVARNDDRDAVLTVDPADGPHRGRRSDLARH